MEQQPHFVKLNSSSISALPLIFRSIILVETILSTAYCALWPLFCIAVYRAGVMHRNFRIQLCLATGYMTLLRLARFVLLYYQLNDLPIDASDPLMFTADVIVDAVLGYYCSIMGSFAIERYVATRLWRWDERASPATILVLIAAESVMTIPTVIGSTMCTAGYMSIDTNFNIFTVMFILSTGAFLRTYSVNERLWEGIAKGARLGGYSVSKTFQYMFSKIIKPSFFYLCGFATFMFKMYGPRKFLVLRDISWALFDFSLAAFALFHISRAIICNPTIFHEFRNISLIRWLTARFRKEVYTIDGATDSYFSQLAAAWNNN